MVKKYRDWIPNFVIGTDSSWHHNKQAGRSSRWVMVNVLDCEIVVSEFELQFSNYVYIRSDTRGKIWTPLSPPLVFFYNDDFGIELPKKVDMSLNKEPNQTSRNEAYLTPEWIRWLVLRIGKANSAVVVCYQKSDILIVSNHNITYKLCKLITFSWHLVVMVRHVLLVVRCKNQVVPD